MGEITIDCHKNQRSKYVSKIVKVNFYLIDAIKKYLFNNVVDQSVNKVSIVFISVNRLRCPKGWKRIGGSCYLLPDVTSKSTLANETCNLVHSNRSNLMQIRHTVELLYAAHVLTKYNLSALLIELDPQWMKGKSMIEISSHAEGHFLRKIDHENAHE